VATLKGRWAIVDVPAYAATEQAERQYKFEYGYLFNLPDKNSDSRGCSIAYFAMAG